MAAIAYLVPVAAHWGVFEYLPAIFWLVIFVQCLFTFRWRGLWFLLGPPVAFLVIVAFLVAAPPVPKRAAASLPMSFDTGLKASAAPQKTQVAADDSPPSPKIAVPDGAATNSTSKPMIIQNRDGTFTIQKEPRNGDAEDPAATKGLVIPPQVVVPMVPAQKR